MGTEKNSKRISLGVSGGIAAYKSVEILRGLQEKGHTVRVAMTRNACQFVGPLTFEALSGQPVIVDEFGAKNSDSIAHISFAQDASLFLIAPATANLIAKFANGIADDFLSTSYLATTIPVLLAPAMNPRMWNHPATQRNLEALKKDGVRIIDPDEGLMACGSIGPGRLSDPSIIVNAALEMMASFVRMGDRDLEGEHFLISTGATREPIDPVRFISNRSSGKMGTSLAARAMARGARVTLVAGAMSVEAPRGVELVRAGSSEDMYQRIMERVGDATVFVGTAAVADYRPRRKEEKKIKKSGGPLVLELEETKDILSEVAGVRKNGMLVIGFAAETDNLIENAEKKLKNKKLDLIVANDVSRADSGFDSSRNLATILAKGREPVFLPLMEKTLLADRIIDEIVSLRRMKATLLNERA